MDRLRTPLFLLACWLLLLAVLIEVGAGTLLGRAGGGGLARQTPGIAIGYLAILDLMLAHAIGLMAVELLAPRSVVGRVQGPLTLVLSLLGVIAAFFLALGALFFLVLLVTLLVAVPFGTIAYLAGWGHFATGAAAATLSIVMLLKLGFAVLLPLAHQRFLQNKGLIVLTGASLGLTWVVAFLHAFPPGFLVSIADAIGALVIGVIGVVWLVLLLIGSLFATLRTLRSGRTPHFT